MSDGVYLLPVVLLSPSSRRAWIEIAQKVESFCPIRVALLAEGVDRNSYHTMYMYGKKVALLAEGVDRNCCIRFGLQVDAWSPSSRRAWIEISYVTDTCWPQKSPSSRRAWIEI